VLILQYSYFYLREITDGCDILKQLVTRKYDLTAGCGEIGEVPQNSSTEQQLSQSSASSEQDLRYSHVMLDWLQWWESDTRDLVLMDAQIHKIGNFQIFMISISK